MYPWNKVAVTIVNMVFEKSKQLGQIITRLRDQRKWSQGQLAAYARMSRPWITQLEAGHYEKPSPVGLIRVAQVLGADYREWFRLLDFTLPHTVQELEKQVSPELAILAMRLEALTPATRRILLGYVNVLLSELEIRSEQLERLDA